MRPDDPSTQEALLGAVQGCVTLSQMSGNKQHNFDEKMSSCLFSRLKHVPGFLATVPNYRLVSFLSHVFAYSRWN